jgi:CheY-like chemotaxis protein
MKKKVLIIDSSKAIRFLLETVLGSDYEVITATDGCSAMYLLSKRMLPDFIITDPQLSDLEDWELIEQLSGSILFSHIPVIVLSSLSQDETRKKCEEYGVVKHFNKPFNPLVLLDAMHRISEKQLIAN